MSSGYLLDTSVLSLLAPGRVAPDGLLARWLHENTDRLYISAVSIAEIEQGICKLRRSGGVERAEALRGWLDSLIENSGDQVIPLDIDTGRATGALSDQAFASGQHPGFADVAIAATAQVHDLLILTRNGKPFAPLGVPFADPVDALPTEP